MKKVLAFNGSPRKTGNTSIMIDKLISNIDNKKIDIEIIYLYDYDINPCIDCRACKSRDLVCNLKDRMKKLYSFIDIADTIIIGSPIYWFGPTAKTKLLLDRFRPYYGNKKLVGKNAVLLLPAGDGESDCDLTIEMFKRSFKYLGVEFLGAVTAKAYNSGEVNQDKTALDNIENLGNKIMAQLI